MPEGLPRARTRKLRIGLRTIVADASGEDAIVEVHDPAALRPPSVAANMPRLLHGPGFDASANACPISGPPTRRSSKRRQPHSPRKRCAWHACLEIAAVIAAGSE